MKKNLSILLSILITVAMTMSVFAMKEDKTVETAETAEMTEAAKEAENTKTTEITERTETARTTKTTEPAEICTRHTYTQSAASPSYKRTGKDTHALVVPAKVCTKCKSVLQRPMKTGESRPHDLKAVSSSCDGETHTLIYSCDACVTLVHETKECPRGLHTGDCRWLPF